MSFFEPPPPPPQPPEQRRRPEWLGPPDNILGVALPWRIVLARTDNVAVVVEGRREILLNAGVAVALAIGLGVVIALGAS